MHSRISFMEPTAQPINTRERDRREVSLMDQLKFDCDCDLVIEMEEMGIGIEEIRQYVKAMFSKEEIEALIGGLEKIAASNGQE